MALSDLLATLSGNEGLNISLVDNTDKTLITFNAAGYASIESDLGTRTVRSIKVVSASAVKIAIDEAQP